jgi:histidine phosphotransferase ChpT
MTDISLAEAIATRLCHDLAGPISACGNGIELLATESDPSMQEQARELLQMSAQEGITRLQFYRTAFGQLKDIRTADVEETRLMAQDFFRRGTIKLDWPQEGAGFEKEMPNALRQTLCSMILCMAALLAYGGKLSVRQKGAVLAVTGIARRIKDDKAALAAVCGKSQPDTVLTPYNVIPHFLTLVAKKSGLKLGCDVNAGEAETVVELTAEYR